MGRWKDPNSRRSKQAAAREARLAVIGKSARPLLFTPTPKRAAVETHEDTPTPPDWLSSSEKDLFRSIVR